MFVDDVDWDSLKGDLYFLGHGPWRILSVVALYLLIVKYGPKIMKNRKPFDLRSFVRVYNLSNIVINMYLLNWGLQATQYGSKFFTCDCLEQNPRMQSIMSDRLITSRVFDFVDTIVFILRKKENQVSGLHVFHHFYVPTAMWFVATASMQLLGGFLAMLNCFVHIIMYGYYFLASFPSLAPHLWWKRYITTLQISQFILALVYYTYCIIYLPLNCEKVPLTPFISNLSGAIIFLILFLSFYSKTYKKKSNPVEKKV